MPGKMLDFDSEIQRADFKNFQGENLNFFSKIMIRYPKDTSQKDYMMPKN